MATHVFIDTNVWLSFFHYSSDDLEELRKIAVLVRSGRLVVYLPEQVVAEARRNRDVKIADALKRLGKETIQGQFPQFCKDYEEYRVARTALTNYNKALEALQEKLEEDIATKSLEADKAIRDLFGVIGTTELSDEVLHLARRRMDLGNPPGKGGSLGDAINWETLLEEVPDETDLFLIAEDRDYASAIDDEKINPYLGDEWVAKKKASVTLYKRLSQFLVTKFPNVKLAKELEKELLVRDLAASPNFKTTRSLLSKLVRIGNLSDPQVSDLVEAAVTNSQIYWIASDSDIKRNLKALVSGRENAVDADNWEMFRQIIGEEPATESEDDEVDFPF